MPLLLIAVVLMRAPAPAALGPVTFAGTTGTAAAAAVEGATGHERGGATAMARPSGDASPTPGAEEDGASGDRPSGLTTGDRPSGPPSEDEPSDSAALALTQEPLPVFVTYEVQPGDTVSGIAARFGIGSDYIVWNNVGIIDDADSLQIGAQLQVPSIEGIIHSVRLDETVSGIAVEYDSSTEAIVAFEANGFEGDADNLPVGRLILVPGGRPAPLAEPAGDPGSPPSSDVPAPGSEAPAPPVAPEPEVVTPPPPPSWVWPAVGRLTNTFGPAHPTGIDISMIVGTPIAAASAGQVVFVGGNPCCSYGTHVIVSHADGYETLYAHLSQVHVTSGQWVNTGDVIASSGNTGYSTGPHLHLETRRNGVRFNPLSILP